MRNFGHMLCLLLALLVLVAAPISVRTRAQESEQQQAQQLWEQAIAAKGGRERLFTVNNMVVSSRGVYATGVFKKHQVRREEVCVLPDKYWFWDDYRPDVFGLTVRMYDYGAKRSYMALNGQPSEPPALEKNGLGRKALITNQADFLLETRSLKPTIIKASSDRIGQHSVAVIQTMIEGERVDFAFDRKTHLPVQISYYDIFHGKTYVRVHKFSDYIDVGGIKVPSTEEYDDGSKYKVSIQFNVQYNESIFVKPPPIEAGPEAWKKK